MRSSWIKLTVAGVLAFGIAAPILADEFSDNVKKAQGTLDKIIMTCDNAEKRHAMAGGSGTTATATTEPTRPAGARAGARQGQGAAARRRPNQRPNQPTPQKAPEKKPDKKP